MPSGTRVSIDARYVPVPLSQSFVTCPQAYILTTPTQGAIGSVPDDDLWASDIADDEKHPTTIRVKILN